MYGILVMLACSQPGLKTTQLHYDRTSPRQRQLKARGLARPQTSPCGRCRGSQLPCASQGLHHGGDGGKHGYPVRQDDEELGLQTSKVRLTFRPSHVDTEIHHRENVRKIEEPATGGMAPQAHAKGGQALLPTTPVAMEQGEWRCKHTPKKGQALLPTKPGGIRNEKNIQKTSPVTQVRTRCHRSPRDELCWAAAQSRR